MSGALGNGSYTRTNGSPQAGRDSTFPRFHMHPVEDPVASAAAGRPIFVQHERVQIIQPGNPNSPVLAVTDTERQRWPEQYAAFRRGEEVSVNGTPLEQWSYLPRNAVLELKALDLHTVEQLAGLPDSAIHKIGMAGRNIRDMAKAYLDDADAQAITSNALARAERAEALVSGLQKQIDEFRPMMDRMHGELMALKNAPSAVDSYIPGNHDPLQNQQPLSQGSVAASSLDSLAAPRRGPGRPPKARDEMAA
jgi:hypothetical protein